MHWSFMTAKRLDSRAFFFAAGLLLAVPAVGAAQQAGGVWRLPEGSGRATTGVQPAPQPQVVIVQPQPNAQRATVFRRRASYGHSPYGQLPYGATVIPAVLLQNGQVYADFGHGFEPVYRSCSAGSVVVSGQPTVIGSNGVVLSPAPPPTYTQPVPNQQTPSQQMAARTTGAQRVVVSGAAQSACYNRDGAGRLFVVRF